MSCKQRDGKGGTNLFHTLSSVIRQNQLHSCIKLINKRRPFSGLPIDVNRQTDRQTDATDIIIIPHSVAGGKNKLLGSGHSYL